MFVIISDEEKDIPQGFRPLTDEEIIKDYLSMDMNENYRVSKNEWMLTFLKLLANDIDSLEKEGPDSIMGKIQELSDEFERYDTDNNKFLDYDEYRELVTKNVFISED